MSDFMERSARIYIAGHRGLVGSALVRRLKRSGNDNFLLRSHQELDLTDQEATFRFFDETRPEYVFMAAAKVGGILANSRFPIEFLIENLAIEMNVLQAAVRSGVRRLLFLGSSCIYPRDAQQPLREEYLMTGPLEETNRAYAMAKIAGIEICRAYNYQLGTRYLAVMPTNLYGREDNFDLEKAHVLPALVRRMHEAKISGSKRVTVWGTGRPRREFLFNDDVADACIFLMNLPDEQFSTLLNETGIVNIGCGKDLSIAELASLIRRVVGYEGEIEWDPSKPDGTPRKLLSVSRMEKLGWCPRTDLEDGIRQVYEHFAAVNA